MIKEVYSIDGMKNTSCMLKIETTIKNLDGIKNCNINFLTKSMSVDYNNESLSRDEIINAVKKLNYDIKLKSSINNYIDFNVFGRVDKKNNEVFLSAIKLRVVINIVFLSLLFYISLSNVLDLKLPNFLKGYENSISFALTQMFLTLPIVYLNRNYYKIGIKNLFKLRPDSSVLVSIGSGAAFLYGVVTVYIIGYGLGRGDITLVNTYRNHLYFEIAAVIPVLMSIGKLIESGYTKHSKDAIEKLLKLIPENAEILNGNSHLIVSSKDVARGDIVIVKEGKNIPVDGIIIEGSGSVDESLITGESLPVEKNPGDNLVSGAECISGSFKMRATAVGKDTTLEKISDLVNEAINARTQTQKLVDKVAGIFVPIIIIIAFITFIIWNLSGKSIAFSLSNAISVLVISCPAALGLATPISMLVGSSKAAANGILIRDFSAFNILSKVDTVVFDKTGTLTNGKAEVIDIICTNNMLEFVRNKNSIFNNHTLLARELLVLAYSLERESMHPLAQAINKEAQKNYLTYYNVEDFESISGMGLNGIINNNKIYAGSISYMMQLYQDGYIEECGEHEKQLAKEYMDNGKTVMFMASKKGIIGIIVVADEIKENSKKVIYELKKRGKDVILLTGDNDITARAIAKELGISKVFSQVLPSAKEEKIKELIDKKKTVLMIGDGINDSPALARADVGMAIGAGSDIAIDAADIVLMYSDLLSAVNALDLSKMVCVNIKENLFLAFFYNIISIPLAAGVFYNTLGLSLNPIIGASIMSFSSIFIVINALRINCFDIIKNT